MDNFKTFIKQYYDQLVLGGVFVIILIYLFLWLVSPSVAGKYEDEFGEIVSKIDTASQIIEPEVPDRYDYVAEVEKSYKDIPPVRWTGDPKWIAYRRPYIKFDYLEIPPVEVHAEAPEMVSAENDREILGVVQVNVKNNGTRSTPEGIRPGYIKTLTLYRRKKGDDGEGEVVRHIAKPAPDDVVPITDTGPPGSSGLDENTEYEYRAVVEADVNEESGGDLVEVLMTKNAESGWVSVRTRLNFHVHKFTMFSNEEPPSVYMTLNVWNPSLEKYVKWLPASYKVGSKLDQGDPVYIRDGSGKSTKVENMKTGYELAEILPNRAPKGKRRDMGIRCIIQDENGVVKTATFWESDKFGTGGSESSDDGSTSEEEKESGKTSEPEKTGPEDSGPDVPEKEQPEKKRRW